MGTNPSCELGQTNAGKRQSNVEITDQENARRLERNASLPPGRSHCILRATVTFDGKFAGNAERHSETGSRTTARTATIKLLVPSFAPSCPVRAEAGISRWRRSLRTDYFVTMDIRRHLTTFKHDATEYRNCRLEHSARCCRPLSLGRKLVGTIRRSFPGC
jgi:hypothetical protein